MQLRLLGACGTGKTALARALAGAVSAAGRPAFVLGDAEPAGNWPQHLAIADGPALPLPVQGAPSLTLLMGLDLPAPGNTQGERETQDQRLRQALAQAGVAYQVVYGLGPDRLRQALHALQAWLPCTQPLAEPGRPTATWVWSCDKCSDPQCERRLLSRLLAQRSPPPG